jgi:magnesium transporter
MSITQIHLADRTTTELTYGAARPTATNGVVWLDVSAPTEDDLAWLARTYNLHALAIEDCRNFNQRAKAESYGDYLFLSLTTTARENGGLRAQELEAFLGPDYLITIHREPLAALDAVRERYAANTRADFLLYFIADHMVDTYFPLLDEMDDEIDALEDRILENATQATLHRIFILKQQLVFLRKITAPMREVMNSLAGTRYSLVEEHTALYFRDVYDHLVRIYDLIETSRDLLGNALDAYLTTVSNRLNEVMKRLTLIATIFMPISFLAGLGGMNFQQLPFDNPAAFVIMLALLALVPTAMLVWFWRSKWV